MTPNLGAALRRLRYKEKWRLVWIDAICVNQEDLDERSQQVMLMRNIYSPARRVIVWLGEDNGQALHAVEIIKIAANYCASELKKPLDQIGAEAWSGHIEREEVFSPGKALKDLSRNLPRVDRNSHPPSPSPWDAVAWFFSHKWFRRIWVIQEVAFAPVIVYIGVIEIEWRFVGIGACWLWEKNYLHTVALRDDYLQAASIFYAKMSGSMPIGLLLMLFDDAEATDARDKVYGLLSLSLETDQASELLRPDYTKTVEQVYMDTVRHTTKINNRYGELEEILGKASNFSNDTSGNFPSWVPRWDLNRGDKNDLDPSEAGASWCAGGKTPQIVPPPDDPRILSMTGSKISVIHSTNNALLDQIAWEALEVIWNEVALTIPVLDGEECLERKLSRTITASQTKDSDGSFSDEQDFRDYLACRNDTRLPITNRTADFLLKVREFAFFTTANHDLGLAGITGIRSGDVVCVFFGHAKPYVLRPVGVYYKFLDHAILMVICTVKLWTSRRIALRNGFTFVDGIVSLVLMTKYFKCLDGS